MSGESTTSRDLVEIIRVIFDASERQDWDAVLNFFAPDAIWDVSPQGLGTSAGPEKIRALWNDWTAPYEHWVMTLDEVLDVGNGIVFAAHHEAASPVGGSETSTRTRLMSLNGSTARFPA
jgi:ketosteroid isomerase-like protein